MGKGASQLTRKIRNCVLKSYLRETLPLTYVDLRGNIDVRNKNKLVTQ